MYFAHLGRRFSKGGPFHFLIVFGWDFLEGERFSRGGTLFRG